MSQKRHNICDKLTSYELRIVEEFMAGASVESLMHSHEIADFYIEELIRIYNRGLNDGMGK